MSITKLFGIDLPIIQAPMAGVQNSALAIAVSNAGGLGSLPCAMLDAKQLAQELDTLHANTKRPFNLNFFCHPVPVTDEAILDAWRKQFSRYYTELGLAPPTPSSVPARHPFDEERAKLVVHFRPPVVSFHFGLPTPELMAMVRSSGAKIISSATTVEEAIWLQNRGVDAIIAQGVEAGGHRGMFLSDDLSTQVGIFALLPQIVRAVSIPVIAAGGIADANGVRAATQLGASGVQVGTSYLLCTEATTSSVHRSALKSADANNTQITNVFTGRPARGIVNRLMREMGPMNSAAPQFPQATFASAVLRTAAEKKGSGDFSPLWAGQNTTGCQEISAGDLTRQLAS